MLDKGNIGCPLSSIFEFEFTLDFVVLKVKLVY